MIEKIIVTEYPDKGWTINLNKFNDETDIIVPKELAIEILRLQSLDHLNAEKGEKCPECNDGYRKDDDEGNSGILGSHICETCNGTGQTTKEDKIQDNEIMKIVRLNEMVAEKDRKIAELKTRCGDFIYKHKICPITGLICINCSRKDCER